MARRSAHLLGGRFRRICFPDVVRVEKRRVAQFPCKSLGEPFPHPHSMLLGQKPEGVCMLECGFP